MKTLENDTELKNLIKGIKLDSPGSDFTSKVMNRVFEEKPVVEIVKNEKLLGRGFWVILSLFALLFLAMFITSNTGIQEDGQLSDLFGKIGSSSLTSGYQSVFSNLGSLPLSIGGILFASSLLILIDKFLPQILPHHHSV
jgi:hypothetical protein